MLTIKQAALSDLETLTELFDKYRVWYRKPSDVEGAHQFIKERLLARDSIIFLAILEDQAIGFTQLYPLFTSIGMRKMWLLNDLYVSKAFRQLKAGTQLINEAKEHCQQTGASGVLLETEKSNEIGNILYPKLQFELQDNNFYFWKNNSIK